MKLRILYFATIRDSAGEREEIVSLTEGSQLTDLKECLGKNHPRLVGVLDTAIFAVNREYALDDHPLNDGDEVAIFPPVSGGSALHPTILRITREALDFNTLLSEIITPTSEAACVLSAVVITDSDRDESRDRALGSTTVEIEKQMERIARAIRERWTSIESLAIIEHCGHDRPGETEFTIVCSASNRATGVHDAARYGIDLVKQSVASPKKEVDSD